MSGYLLDTSVLLALGLDDHLQNSAAEQWLTRDVGRFATCPLTQLGFLRITKQLRRDISNGLKPKPCIGCHNLVEHNTWNILRAATNDVRDLWNR